VGVVENLRVVRDRVGAACRRAGRSPDEVAVVGVSKTFPAALVAEACRAGLADVAENRVQEAADKIPQVEALGAQPRWHLVGHLQTNKVKTALGLFDIIHSVDSVRLAESSAVRPKRRLLSKEARLSGGWGLCLSCWRSTSAPRPASSASGLRKWERPCNR
jgi:uncharacterized pyridoxal phosphate-containing UPF0001 family protein